MPQPAARRDRGRHLMDDRTLGVPLLRYASRSSPPWREERKEETHADEPHARPRGVDAGAARRLLDGRHAVAQQRRPRPFPPPRPRAESPSAAASASAAAALTPADIKIGSDNFYESKLVAEIYAQVLENARLHGRPPLRPRLAPGPRSPALEGGQVDLVPEYVGSGLGYYDKTRSPATARQPHRAAGDHLTARAAA